MHELFRQRLLSWYRHVHRDLPWRNTCDPYAIWISEIMLQQTRVAAVIPYYQKFLALFPDVRALAETSETELLHAWAGLGYYSRARNLQAAAQQMGGSFPRTYEAIRALRGIGDYTAAAIASIAFNLPHAAVDGNVLRVLSRITCEAGDIGSATVRQRLGEAARELLDRTDPGTFNQAMMELGATTCLPRDPRCLLCPVAQLCAARLQGKQNELPVKLRRVKPVKLQRSLLVIRKQEKILFWQRDSNSPKLRGFFELPEPEQLPGASLNQTLGQFRHSITNHSYLFTVVTAAMGRKPKSFVWLSDKQRETLPLSTTARKALALFASSV